MDIGNKLDDQDVYSKEVIKIKPVMAGPLEWFMKKSFVVLAIVVIFLAGCAQSTQTVNPAWVDQMIKQIESNPVANPPLSVWRYAYNGQTVYFVPARCCDIPSMVFDAQGTALCSPDGGFTGQGDGKCPGFFEQRSSEQLIWQDTRAL
jgi:hypothetical protein